MINYTEIEMMEEREGIEEDVELYNFVESPECAKAIIQYFKTIEQGAESEELIYKATKLLDILTFNTHMLGCILRGEVVCIDGAFYPGDINKVNINNTLT